MKQLKDYPVEHIKTRCMDVINNQYKIVSQQAREREWPVSVRLPGLTELFPHLYLDEDYELFGYYAWEYHGLFGEIAAVHKSDDHTAMVKDFVIPIIQLPKKAVDPMEVFYCDGSAEGYIEAIILKRLLDGLHRFEINDWIVSSKGIDITSWERIVEVNDWNIKYKLLKDGCYVSLFSRNEPSIEDSDIPISIYLKQYSFCDDIDLYRALKKEDHSEFPHKLEGRRRYKGDRHCCIMHESSVVIAQTTEPLDCDEV